MTSPRRFAGLLTLVILAVWACSGRDIAAPAPAGTVASLAQAGEGGPGGKDPFVKCRPDGAYRAAADIGPAGGRLVVGRNRLIVPAGALSRTIHIVATAPGDTLAFVAFEPSGLVFSKPVRLVLDVRRCNLNATEEEEEEAAQGPHVVYLDDDRNILEWLPARRDLFRQTVSAPIRHFSGYAVAW